MKLLALLFFALSLPVWGCADSPEQNSCVTGEENCPCAEDKKCGDGLEGWEPDEFGDVSDWIDWDTPMLD